MPSAMRAEAIFQSGPAAAARARSSSSCGSARSWLSRSCSRKALTVTARLLSLDQADLVGRRRVGVDVQLNRTVAVGEYGICRDAAKQRAVGDAVASDLDLRRRRIDCARYAEVA